MPFELWSASPAVRGVCYCRFLPFLVHLGSHLGPPSIGNWWPEVAGDHGMEAAWAHCACSSHCGESMNECQSTDSPSSPLTPVAPLFSVRHRNRSVDCAGCGSFRTLNASWPCRLCCCAATGIIGEPGLVVPTPLCTTVPQYSWDTGSRSPQDTNILVYNGTVNALEVLTLLNH